MPTSLSVGYLPEDGDDATGIPIRIDEERRPIDAVAARPFDGKRGRGFHDLDRFSFAISGEPCGPRRSVRSSSHASPVSVENRTELTNRDDASVMVGGPLLDVAHLVGQPNAAAFHDPLARATRLADFRSLPGSRGVWHGPVHPAVRRLAGLRLPLLRPHRHIRLPQRAVATRAGGELLPSSRWRPRGQQGDPGPTAHCRLSELGGSLRTQSSHPARVGRKRACARKTMSCRGNASHGAGEENYGVYYDVSASTPSSVCSRPCRRPGACGSSCRSCNTGSRETRAPAGPRRHRDASPRQAD